jgi:PIN domain nuclease of toxin-antitoxin system
VIADQECHVSLASFWEIAIKVSLQKLKLPSSFDRYLPEQMSTNGFSSLEIDFRRVAGCVTLPWRHRDPFDLLLVSQTIEGDLALVSRDTIFDDYGVRRIW